MKRILEFLGWWLWRRWRIYCPPGPVPHESTKSIVARLNKNSWPCSDKALANGRWTRWKTWYAYHAPDHHLMPEWPLHNFTSRQGEAKCVWCGRSRHDVRHDQKPWRCLARLSTRQRLETALDCIRSGRVRRQIRRIFENEIPNASVFWDGDERQVELIANDWEIIIRERDDTCHLRCG